METVRNYKCPNCGAPLVFGADSGKLHCDSCGNDFDIELMNSLDDEEKNAGSSKYDWTHYEPRNFDEAEAAGLAKYNCPSCGAEITGDETLGATVCPYCANANIIKSKFEGALKPDYVIPFKLDKKAAVEAFENACGNAPFLPDEFKDKKRISEMTGVYVPFWMFDCDCNADITYSAQRTSHWSDSEYNYTKTDYYRLYRSGSIGFANVPVDGSKKADDTYMEALEPFDYNDAVNFDTAYLSGYFADKYDVSGDESEQRANERIKASTEAAFSTTTGGFLSVLPISSGIRFSEGKIRYALLPVWMLNIKYAGEIYKYAINGQTGKTAGKFPICKKKRNIYFAKVFAAALAVCCAAAVAYLYWF